MKVGRKRDPDGDVEFLGVVGLLVSPLSVSQDERAVLGLPRLEFPGDHLLKIVFRVELDETKALLLLGEIGLVQLGELLVGRAHALQGLAGVLHERAHGRGNAERQRLVH
jgi:hypothetical protein